jgi:hypothetical protein
VAISAAGANATVSGDDGAFVLSFPQGYPGQDVRLIVNHPGWDAVNAILLDQRLPDDAGARPLEIILCRSDERKHWVAAFYRLDDRVAGTRRTGAASSTHKFSDVGLELCRHKHVIFEARRDKSLVPVMV